MTAVTQHLGLEDDHKHGSHRGEALEKSCHKAHAAVFYREPGSGKAAVWVESGQNYPWLCSFLLESLQKLGYKEFLASKL